MARRGSSALPCTGPSLWTLRRPPKVPPAWGEKKLWSHKTGLGGPSDKNHLSASPPTLTGQKGGWASGLSASSVGREWARAAGLGTLPSYTASPAPGGGWCVSCPACAAHAPMVGGGVCVSRGAPCRPDRELQAGLLWRSLRACVPLGSPGHSPLNCPSTSQTRVYDQVQKPQVLPDTGSPALCLLCVPPP